MSATGCKGKGVVGLQGGWVGVGWQPDAAGGCEGWGEGEVSARMEACKGKVCGEVVGCCC